MHSHEHAPPFARTFTKLKYQCSEPRPAFDAYIAVWRESPDKAEVVIGAPTVEILAERWLRITGVALVSKRAQHVIMTYCSAPEELWRQAKEIAEAASPDKD